MYDIKTIAIATGFRDRFLLINEVGNCRHLPSNVANSFSKQINYSLLNNANLFDFISRPPMLSIFYECETLCPLA